MIKILVINGCSYLGGDNRTFALRLSVLTPDRYQLYCITSPRGDAYENLKTLPNIKLFPMEMGGKEMLPASRSSKAARAVDIAMAVFRAARLVHREKIDVIYSMDRGVGIGISFAVSKLTGCPMIYSGHIWHYLTTSRLHRMALKHADFIIATSKRMRDNFAPYVRNEKSIHIIHNAIPIKKFDPELNLKQTELRAEFGLPPHEPLVVLAGRLSPYKGQDDLIRAAEIVLKQIPNCNFVMVGSDDRSGYAGQLNNMIAERRLEQRVRLLEFQTNMAKVYACADVITMPSHEEPFGLVALEAMAMEKPVVATRAGGVPEFFPDGEAGFLIEPKDYHALADSIIKLLNNPAMAQEMGRKGREVVKNSYSEAAYTERVTALFRYVTAELAAKRSHVRSKQPPTTLNPT